jgi:hypothetical protein
MLWNSEPDAVLQQEAQQNRLRVRSSVERQVRRMLADDRAQAFVARFFVPWLQLDALAKADPDTKYFPDYDVSLRDSLARETELFLLSQLREDRDPIELWSANYSFLNEQLAKHYGIPNVSGLEFRRTPLPAPERAGLLGQGSIMMVTSRHEHGVDAAYTTPTERLLIYASAGAVGPTSATPDSLVRARHILRSTPNPRWSMLIAAIVQ